MNGKISYESTCYKLIPYFLSWCITLWVAGYPPLIYVGKIPILFVAGLKEYPDYIYNLPNCVLAGKPLKYKTWRANLPLH